MDLPNEDTYLIIFCCISLISLFVTTLYVTIEAAYSSCVLSEETFENFKSLEPARQNKLIWLLNRPLAIHRAMLFFQTLFVSVTALSLACGLYAVSAGFLAFGLTAAGIVVLITIGTIAGQRIGVKYPTSTLKSFASFTYFSVKAAQPLLRSDITETDNEASSDTFSVEGLEQALEMQKTEEEKDILDSVLHFGEETVAEVMVPRVDVVDISYHADFKTVMQCVLENNYSRIPIRDNNQDKIKGILYVKDLLPYCKEGNDFQWQKLIRPPFFVPESKMIDDLLREFQKSKIHIAVVVDEYGITSGIVTMEDILEEIVGEINDEYDEEEKQFIRLDDKRYIFEGKTPLTDFFETLDLNEDDFSEEVGEAETLAGFVLELMNEFPTKHQQARCRQLLFEVLALDKRRISKIKVTITDEEAKTDDATEK